MDERKQAKHRNEKYDRFCKIMVDEEANTLVVVLGIEMLRSHDDFEDDEGENQDLPEWKNRTDFPIFFDCLRLRF